MDTKWKNMVKAIKKFIKEYYDCVFGFLLFIIGSFLFFVVLGHGVDVAAEMEVRKIVQKLLAENTAGTEICDILLVKVQILDIVDQLVEAGGNGVPASVRHRAEINVEIGNAILEKRCAFLLSIYFFDFFHRNAILEPGFQVTIAHGQLVKVAEHGHIQLLIGLHSHLIVSRRGLCRAL